MVFLESARLILRNLEPKDVGVMYDYRNHEACTRYQRGQIRDRDGIASLILRRGADRIGVDAPFMLSVADKTTDEMVGEIVVKPEHGVISMGYTFSYRHHRKGYAFESIKCLTDCLHECFPQWQFICYTEPENEASIGLLKKLGYQDLGFSVPLSSQMFGKWLSE